MGAAEEMYGNAFSYGDNVVYRMGVQGSLDNLHQDLESAAVAGATDTGTLRHDICQATGRGIEATDRNGSNTTNGINGLARDICHTTGRIVDAVGDVGTAVAAAGSAAALGLSEVRHDICQSGSGIRESVNHQGHHLERSIDAVLANACQNASAAALQAERIAAAAALKAAEDAAAAAKCCCEVKCAVKEEGCETRSLIREQTSTLLVAGTANTQAILDKLCNSEIQNLRERLAEKDNALQTATLLSSIHSQCGHHGGYHGCGGSDGPGNSGRGAKA